MVRRVRVRLQLFSLRLVTRLAMRGEMMSLECYGLWVRMPSTRILTIIGIRMMVLVTVWSQRD